MAQVSLPQSIDAGTDAIASEVQSNFVALRDAINGDLEGGATGNLKANGVTARELVDTLLVNGLPGAFYREGLANNVDELKITPGAGLALNYASGTAWVRDDSGVVASTALIPVTITGSTVTIAANSSGNPRIDQIILTMNGYGTGSVSVLQGTATAGATLENRTGAAALPSDAIRLADVLMANGFAGPFVDHTSLRNRQPWAKPMEISFSAAFDLVVDSLLDEFVKIDFRANTVALSSLSAFVNNVTSAPTAYALSGQNTVTTPATGSDNRGTYSATANWGLFLGVIPANPVAGGMHYSGSATFYGSKFAWVANDTWHLDSRFAATSLTASGSHAITEGHVANVWAASLGTNVHYLRIADASGGAVSGKLYVERVHPVSNV